MVGSLVRQAWITREQVRNHPNVYYIFGDNLEEKGYGGQAAAMRGEPNAIGIPTKRSPSMNPDAFYSDSDFETVKTIYDQKFYEIEMLLKRGSKVVIPKDGLGTNRARLQESSPLIFNYLRNCIRRLEKKFGRCSCKKTKKHYLAEGRELYI